MRLPICSFELLCALRKLSVFCFILLKSTTWEQEKRGFFGRGIISFKYSDFYKFLYETQFG